MPQAIQVYVPAPEAQLSVLPALAAEDPATTEIAATLLAGYVSVHWSAAGSLPAGEVKFRFSETAPFAAAVPEDNAKESVWLNAVRPATRKNKANGSPKPFVDEAMVNML
jgi:hypothetical protein